MNRAWPWTCVAVALSACSAPSFHHPAPSAEQRPSPSDATTDRAVQRAIATFDSAVLQRACTQAYRCGLDRAGELSIPPNAQAHLAAFELGGASPCVAVLAELERETRARLAGTLDVLEGRRSEESTWQSLREAIIADRAILFGIQLRGDADSPEAWERCMVRSKSQPPFPSDARCLEFRVSVQRGPRFHGGWVGDVTVIVSGDRMVCCPVLTY